MITVSQVTKISIFRKALDSWRYDQIAKTHNGVSKQRIGQIIKEIRLALVSMDDWPGSEEQRSTVSIKQMRIDRDVWISALDIYHSTLVGRNP